MDKDTFNQNLIFLRKKFATKEELLHFFAEQLSLTANVSGCDTDTIYQALLEREDRGATAVGGGIAIPHCGLPNAAGFVLTVATIEDGLDYGAFDNLPCKLFFCIVGPKDDRNTHVRLLSMLTVGLTKPQALEKLLRCSDAAEFFRLLMTLMGVEKSAVPLKPPINIEQTTKKTATATESLFRVELFCQRERYFRRLLEEVAACSICAPAVVEASNISSYLRAVPLYASLWSDERKNRFLRLIIGVINRNNYEKLLGSVQIITAKRQGRGVLLLCQPLEGCYGSLDY